MKYLVYGAGTIGTTYAYLLSQTHDVDLLVKQEQFFKISKGINIAFKDLRKRADTYIETLFHPNCVTEIRKKYDGILVAVNRYQLKDVLPLLRQKQHYTSYFAFMQNNWNIQLEIAEYLTGNKYIIAFPSTIGGGRNDKGIKAIIFNEPTRLGGQCAFGIKNLKEGLKRAGIKTLYDKAIFDWLKIHYLQQSITAGAVLENGSFENFAHNYMAIKKMVKAFREGIAVCQLHGINTKKIFPANLFRLPVPIIAHTIQKMFLEENTMEMVNNHMQKGLPEWIVGYREVLADGLNSGLPMTIWKSYSAIIENYMKAHKKEFINIKI